MQIIKHLGSNLIKVRAAKGQIKYGYYWTYKKKRYLKANWDTKKLAGEAFDRLKVKVKNPNRLDFEDSPITLDELLVKWEAAAIKRRNSDKRIHEVKKYFNMFIEVAGSTLLIHASEDDLLAYQNLRLKDEKKIHNHTINKEIDMIRTVLLAATSIYKIQWIAPNVTPLPQRHKGREVYRSRDELGKILDALQEPVSDNDPGEKVRRQLCYDAVVIGIETALRISEVAGLEKSQVYFDRGIGFKYGFILLDSAKTDKENLIRISPTVAEILKRRSETNPGKFLFRREDQQTNTVCQNIRRALKKACKKVGIPYGLMTKNGTVFHTLRHSTITDLIVKKKQPLPTVMKFSRHTSLKTLEKYLHPQLEDVEAVYEDAEIKQEQDQNQDAKSKIM